jgi:hypothetical protein
MRVQIALTLEGWGYTSEARLVCEPAAYSLRAFCTHWDALLI